MGKFADELTEYLYDETLEGFADEEIGTADGFGWYGRVREHILCEDSQGFVDRVSYVSEVTAEAVFAELVTAALEWETETGIDV